MYFIRHFVLLSELIASSIQVCYNVTNNIIRRDPRKWEDAL